MDLNIELLSENAKMPTRGSEYAAGYDLYGANDSSIIIQPHSTEKIPTDIAMAIPENYFGAIFARSGIATKRSLRPANCVGVVDADYRGNIIVALHNDSDEPRTIDPHERIAQLVLIPYLSVNLQVCDDLNETQRGSGGFGSTGKV